jgi:hypothetical protein
MATPRKMIGSVFVWNGNNVALQTEMDGPSFQNEAMEFTNFGSSSGYREYGTGPKDGGEIKLTLHYDPLDSSHQALVTDAISGVTRAWSITWGDTGATESGNGFISDFTRKGSFEDWIDGDLTIKVTGPISVA